MRAFCLGCWFWMVLCVGAVTAEVPLLSGTRYFVAESVQVPGGAWVVNTTSVPPFGDRTFLWRFQVREQGVWCPSIGDMQDSTLTRLWAGDRLIVQNFLHRNDITAAHFWKRSLLFCETLSPGQIYRLEQTRWTSVINSPYVVIRTHQQAYAHVIEIHSWLGLYFGAVVGFLVINALLALWFRSSLVGVYLIFLLSYLLATLGYTDSEVILLGPLPFTISGFMPFLVGLTCFALNLFTVMYFRLFDHRPWLGWFLIAQALVTLVLGSLNSFVGPLFPVQINMQYFVAEMAVCLLISLYCWWKNFPYASLFVFSWGLCFFGFVVLWSNSLLHFAPDEWLIDMYAPTLGHIAEMVLFTFTLSRMVIDRGRQVVQQSQFAQRRQQKLLEEATLHLPALARELQMTKVDFEGEDAQDWHRALDRLVRTTSSFAVIDELTRGNVEVGRSISLVQYVRQSGERWRILLNGPTLRVRSSLANDVLVSEKFFTWILDPLLDNAAKFGRIEVRLDIEFVDDQLLLCLQDDGPGFPEELLEKAEAASFFWQKERHLNRSHQGLGLGLSMVRGAIGPCGVSLEMKNTEHGARATLRVPCTLGDELVANEWYFHTEKSVELESPQHSIFQPWLLIVDDNAMNRKVLRKICEKASWPVHEAKDGFEALELMPERGCAGVLMDLQMPGLDGLEATRRWREQEQFRHRKLLPILAITAHDGDGTLDECLAVGMQGLLSKPFQAELLLKKMEEIGIHRPRKTSHENY